MAKGLSAAKAKRILQDGYVKGKPLTAKQKKYFGAIASGATPLKAIDGADVEKAQYGRILKWGKELYDTARGIDKITDVAKVSKKFESSIDWAKWNKAIPENKALIKEYNAIEEATKKNGTWMKNSDGSKFTGSPEQFVQQNSKNFKKAFPDGFTKGYRGAKHHIDDFVNRDRNDWATFLTDSKENAATYAGSDGVPKTYFHPDVDKQLKIENGLYPPQVNGVYELGFPNNLPTVTGNANGKGWRLLDYDSKIEQGIKLDGRVGDHQQSLLNWTEQGFADDYGLKGFNPSARYLTTDNYASYVKNKANKEAVAKIKNVKDQMGYSDILANTVFALDAERVPLKSLRHNNGMFDMTNSNIYKAIVPGAIGAGAASEMIGPAQADGQFKNGGWLDKFGMGGNLPGASGMMYSRNSGSSAMSPPNLNKAQDGTVEYGTPEYKKAYEEGTFADVPNQLDEVVMYSGVDYEKYPYYNDLSAEQRKYFNDPGAIGRGVRRAAYTKRGLAEDTYDVVNPIMYGALALAGGMAAGPSIATLGRGAAPYVSRYAINPIQRALSYKPFKGPISISNIIDGSSAAYAGYATPEAYNKFKENPSFDTGLDLGLTAMDLVPFGEIFTGGKNIKNLYKKAKNLFTNDLTPNPNMYYRGIGQSGLDDITESGLLRAKPADQIPFNGMGTKFDFAKRFNNLYVTPRLNVADQYGRGVVAEIPKDIADFSKRYKNSDWSMMTNNQIPIEEVNLYKKNFFGNYKPINIPQPSLSSMPFSKPNIYPTSSPLPKYMEPYLSRRVYPFNKEQEVFESFLSTDRRLNNIDSKSLYYNQAGKRITKGEADNLLYPPEYQKNGGDVDKAQYGRILKWGKDIYDGIRGADKATDAVKIINKSGLDISNLGGTSKDIANVAKKIKDRLMTDKFITNNMNATGRTRQQVVESIENFTSEFNKGSITFEDFEKNLGGIYYGEGNIGINTNLKAAGKDDVLGTIDHEVNHLFSDSKGSYVLVDGKLQKQPLYDNYPSLKITTDPSANVAGGSLYQSVAPEQQVRQRKAIAWLEENAGLKMGDDITEEMVEKLGIGLKEGEIKFAKRNTNGKWTAPPDEGGKFEYEFLKGDYKSGVEGGGQLQNGKYNDIGELLNNINDQSIVPPGSFSIVPTTPVGSKRWIKAVTNILNKTYTVGAVGGLGAASQMIGPTQADGQFKEGGEVPKAQFGWLNKLYKMYKGTNKVVDATSKTGKLKYMDELSSKAKKDVYEQNYEALSKTDKETRYLGKPHTAQEEYGEGWKYSDQVDFNNPEEVAAHRKRWIASQKKGNLINDNRRFPFFDETGDIFLDLSRKDLSDYLKKGLDKRFGTIGNSYTTGYGHKGLDYKTDYLNDYFKNYRVTLPDGSNVPYGKLDGSVEIDPSSFNSSDEVMEELRRLAQRRMGDQFNNAFEKTSRIDFGDLLKNKNRNGGWLSKYENGGVIEDDRGQWAHPGEVTKINSNNITMKGVNYPVLGVSDTGDTKMMQPGVENYTYDGSSVTEYPMAKDGKSLVELDQLTNFTNYNTPQPGGWLDKY